MLPASQLAAVAVRSEPVRCRGGADNLRESRAGIEWSPVTPERGGQPVARTRNERRSRFVGHRCPALATSRDARQLADRRAGRYGIAHGNRLQTTRRVADGMATPVPVRVSHSDLRRSIASLTTAASRRRSRGSTALQAPLPVAVDPGTCSYSETQDHRTVKWQREQPITRRPEHANHPRSATARPTSGT